MGIQFVHRRMVATEAQISYIQSLYYSLCIALVTKMISKNEHSPVSKASGQPLWLHGTEAICGKIHWNNFFRERECEAVWKHMGQRKDGRIRLHQGRRVAQGSHTTGQQTFCTATFCSTYLSSKDAQFLVPGRETQNGLVLILKPNWMKQNQVL